MVKCCPKDLWKGCWKYFQAGNSKRSMHPPISFESGENPLMSAPGPNFASRDTKVLQKQRIKCWEYDMRSHARTAVAKYLELANLSEKSLRQVSTPCLDDHMIAEEDFHVKGHLDLIASRVVLTCLYLARHNRPDIL